MVRLIGLVSCATWRSLSIHDTSNQFICLSSHLFRSYLRESDAGNTSLILGIGRRLGTLPNHLPTYLPGCLDMETPPGYLLDPEIGRARIETVDPRRPTRQPSIRPRRWIETVTNTPSIIIPSSGQRTIMRFGGRTRHLFMIYRGRTNEREITHTGSPSSIHHVRSRVPLVVCLNIHDFQGDPVLR